MGLSEQELIALEISEGEPFVVGAEGEGPEVTDLTKDVEEADARDAAPDEDEDTSFTYDDNEPNLVKTFLSHPRGVKALEEIAARVMSDFEDAHDSSSEYRVKRRDNWKMFAGDLPSKQPPFEDSANCHVPVLIEAFSRTHSQFMAEIFGDWSNIVGVQGTGPDDEGQADAISLHLNWQFTEDIPDFPRQASRGVMGFLGGDVSAYSYFDEHRRRNHHKVLTPDDVVVPFTHTSTQNDYSDCPFVVMIMHYYRHELQSESGWHGVQGLIDGGQPSWDDDPEMLIGQAVSETIGVDISSLEGDSRAPFTILHYEGWDIGILPGQDHDRYIQVIMDHKSRTVLKLSIHEHVDWKDQVKYRKQRSEWIQYVTGLEQYNRVMASVERFEGIQQGLSANEAIGQDHFSPQAPQAPLASPEAAIRPPRPDWMDDHGSSPETPKLRPIHMFTHAVCIEPMHGTLGLGFLDYLADYNRMANTALSQFTDAATLANASTFLFASGLEPEDDFTFSPGQINTIQGATASGGELEKGIREIKTQPANPQMMDIVEMAKRFAEGAMQSNPVLSGESGKSGETWRGHASRLEAATKQMSVRARVLTNSFFKPIYEKNCRLNTMFLPEHEMVSLLDWKTQMMETIPIGREMYLKDYNIRIRSDLRFASESQRVQEAIELSSLVNDHPMLQHNEALQHAAAVRLFEARRNHELIPLLGPAPSPVQRFGLPLPPEQQQPQAPPGPPSPPPEQ